MAGDGFTSGENEFDSGSFFAASSWQNDINLFYRIDIGSYIYLVWKDARFTVHVETARSKIRSTLPTAPTPRSNKTYRRARTIIRHAVKAWCLENSGYSLSKRGPGHEQ